MSIEFEPIHVRPMTESPTGPFRYIYQNCVIGQVHSIEEFKPGHQCLGWILSFATPKPPQPKEGEWWMCEGSGWKKPLFYNHNRWFTTETMPVLSCAVITPLYKMERAEG